MKPYWMILLAIPLMGFTFLDPVAKKNQEGNELFQQGEYDEALKRYREAQVEAQNRPELHPMVEGICRDRKRSCSKK